MRRRAYLHELLERVPEKDLFGVQLFLELLVEPAPGAGPEEVAAIEELIRLVAKRK